MNAGIWLALSFQTKSETVGATMEAANSDSLDSLLPFWEHEDLRIISERRIRDFNEKHSDAGLALAN
jgi:hypothetical protein